MGLMPCKNRSIKFGFSFISLTRFSYSNRTASPVSSSRFHFSRKVFWRRTQSVQKICAQTAIIIAKTIVQPLSKRAVNFAYWQESLITWNKSLSKIPFFLRKTSNLHWWGGPSHLGHKIRSSSQYCLDVGAELLRKSNPPNPIEFQRKIRRPKIAGKNSICV